MCLTPPFGLEIMATKNEINQTLAPLSKEPAQFRIGAADIEGVGGPNGFIIGGAYVENEYHTFDTALSMLEFFKRRKYRGYRFAFHNLKYDYGILEPFTTKFDYPLLVNGRPFKVRLADGHNHATFLIDSWLFAAGLSLAKIGESINLPKLETPAELIDFSPSQHTQQDLEIFRKPHVHDYLKRDVEIVQAYMELFQETINQLGGQMKFTLASTAMDLFRRGYLENEYRTPFEARNEYARNAYYGGRVEPYKIGEVSNVNIYDINSLYPYVMSTYEYPDPNTLQGPIDNDNVEIIYKYEGVSDVTVNIPEMYIPPLPYRHEGKLYFPVGELRGHFTHAELINALQYGVKIKAVHSTLFSTQTCSPFVNYVSDLYQLRQQYKLAGDSRELVIKILLNSLYGKFGQRTNAGLQEIRSFNWWLNSGQPSGVEFREIDGFITVLVTKDSLKQPDYVNTLWASYITSYARMTLLNYMRMAEHNLIYCDTDSVFIRGRLETSQNLGGMKLENENVDTHIIGPKSYVIYADNEPVKTKCKGIPAPQRLEFFHTGRVTFSRPIGLLEAGRRKPLADGTVFYPSMWIDVVKQHQDTPPKRLILPSPFPQADFQETAPYWSFALP